MKGYDVMLYFQVVCCSRTPLLLRNVELSISLAIVDTHTSHIRVPVNTDVFDEVGYRNQAYATDWNLGLTGI